MQRQHWVAHWDITPVMSASIVATIPLHDTTKVSLTGITKTTTLILVTCKFSVCSVQHTENRVTSSCTLSRRPQTTVRQQRRGATTRFDARFRVLLRWPVRTFHTKGNKCSGQIVRHFSRMYVQMDATIPSQTLRLYLQSPRRHDIPDRGSSVRDNSIPLVQFHLQSVCKILPPEVCLLITPCPVHI